MARAIPQKKHATKKKVQKKHSIKSMSQKQIDREIDRMLKDYDEITDERYDWAKKMLKGQPPELLRCVNRMVAVMKQMSKTANATVTVRGAQIKVNIPEMVQERNFIYCAVRIILALAAIDIQIAGFKAPRACAHVDCGKKLKKKGG